MKVLTTSSSAQNIDVIPRTYASSYTLKLRDTSINSGQFTFDETSGSHDNDYIIV